MKDTSTATGGVDVATAAVLEAFKRRKLGIKSVFKRRLNLQKKSLVTMYSEAITFS